MIDGDRWLRLPGAVVHLWGRSGRTDRHGVAEIRVPWRRALPVTVSARGYGERTVYEDFAAYRKLTVRVYRPDLQWPLYGAVGTRTQSQVHIRLRPPVPHGLGGADGRADRVPGGRRPTASRTSATPPPPSAPSRW